MGLFGPPARKRVIVRWYGRWTFLGFLSPLLTVIMMSRLDPTARIEAEDRAVMADVAEMAGKGYRVAQFQRYEMPLLGIDYRTVTFELVSPG
jgi:hypothetical protein